MARSFNGSNQRVTWPSQFSWGGGGFSISMRALFNPHESTQFFFATHTALGNASLVFWNNAADQFQMFVNRNTAPSTRTIDVSGLSLSTWYTINIVVPDPTSPSGWRIYIDGTEPAGATTSAGSGTVGNTDNNLDLGGRSVGSPARWMNGQLAEVAFWETQLSTSGRAMLDAGFSPQHIKNGLRFFAPLRGAAAEHNLLTGDAGTLHNTPAIVTHPPVNYPGSGRLIAVDSGTHIEPEPTGYHGYAHAMP